MFTLAHLSDPHLGPLPRASLRELAGKRALGAINWHRKRHAVHQADVLARIVCDMQAAASDHIAVTGDLVNIGLPGEFAPGRSFLEGLGSPADVTFVPGNHDAYVRATAEHPQLHWAAYMRGDGAPSDAAISFPFLRRRGPVALIGLSSAIPTLPFMASGRLGREQIERMTHLLALCAEENLFRVVLIHHPPVSKRSRHLKRLIDGPAFCSALVRHGAELVLHGHDHVHRRMQLAGMRGAIPVIGAPSASAVPISYDDPAAYNLYRIDGAPGAWRCELVSRGMRREGGEIGEINRVQLMGS
jgi:3',5'-cyclic AMP phosphodiesterase CpdA